ncbi:hypothetical protein ACF1BN_32060 [Streptomyces sp. NPDC014861]|uniref:hypothetical protein n=1 Tax=Streptomyces sp. NPDC014861 TaxID=3364923 RepID=UPI0036F582B0
MTTTRAALARTALLAAMLLTATTGCNGSGTTPEPPPASEPAGSADGANAGADADAGTGGDGGADTGTGGDGGTDGGTDAGTGADGGTGEGVDAGTGTEGDDTGGVRWSGGVRLDVDTYQDLDDQPSGGRGSASSGEPEADLRVQLRRLTFKPGAGASSWPGPPERPARSTCSALLQPLSTQETVPLPDGTVWCFRTVQGRYGFLQVKRVDLHALTVDVTVWEGTSG